MSNSLDPDQDRQIWVQTVYKGYQPTTIVPVSKERFIFQDHIATEEEECVPHEMANRMSLFYANSTPMLKMLSDTTSQFVSQVRLTIILVIVMRKIYLQGRRAGKGQYRLFSYWQPELICRSCVNCWILLDLSSGTRVSLYTWLGKERCIWY